MNLPIVNPFLTDYEVQETKPLASEKITTNQGQDNIPLS
jgi:hypothetical protein